MPSRKKEKERKVFQADSTLSPPQTYGQRVKSRVEGSPETEVREADWGQVEKGLNKIHFIPMEYKL